MYKFCSEILTPTFNLPSPLGYVKGNSNKQVPKATLDTHLPPIINFMVNGVTPHPNAQTASLVVEFDSYVIPNESTQRSYQLYVFKNVYWSFYSVYY